MKDALEKFAKFGKNLYWCLLFNKVVGWKLPALSKKQSGTGVAQ